MLGLLPVKLLGLDINSDFRAIITVLQAWEDDYFNDEDKIEILLRILYKDQQLDDVGLALTEAKSFLNRTRLDSESTDEPILISWVQDIHLIFDGIISTHGTDPRTLEYLHWWSFLGLFHGIKEGTFSNIIRIRSKINNAEKLDKWEEEYYLKNRHMVDLDIEKKRLEREMRRCINGR